MSFDRNSRQRSSGSSRYSQRSEGRNNNFRSRSGGGGRSGGGNYQSRGNNTFRGGSFNRNRGGGGRRNFSNSEKIDQRRYIAEPKPIVKYHTEKRFSEFQLHEKLLNNVLEKGYSNPTEVQEKTIPMILEGKSILGISATGSGKTAAFLIPLIDKILRSRDDQKVLVVAPTRELAMQIQQEAVDLVKGTHIKVARVIGGESIYNQQSFLKRNPQIIIGTPGRLKDMYDRKALPLRFINNLVLDEVDRMLDMGFVDEIKFLTAQMENLELSLFFSATVNNKIESIILGISPNYQAIKLSGNTSSENVHQDIVRVANYQDKLEKLHEILVLEEVQKTIIFIETKREVDKVMRELQDRGHRVDGIHGNKSQSQRKRIIESYRSNRFTILLATNVVARGLDVPDITHVINFDEPQTYDEYIHRIGRTGRNGKAGKALTFVR